MQKKCIRDEIAEGRYKASGLGSQPDHSSQLVELCNAHEYVPQEQTVQRPLTHVSSAEAVYVVR